MTGGNKGIGFATVRRLAEQGFTVYLGARDEAPGTLAARQLQAEDLDVRCKRGRECEMRQDCTEPP
ncbi:SDR family NAD(P)-dependent oxidoreductase [Sinomonas terrae]|uniref:SDR family NAD(P)-dependent oxidoreductase n=1 Tax=Sinomonas terrae TaxID=2908838 RepID=A0ABS9U178_9MICC|nr:SDR family NAD(P)-dependent oxidoreductase [Sinomonas terrae]MCH6470080.1 SDR family NAD(P)-dependent oxidoreductase [Sinomonas terrae]